MLEKVQKRATELIPELKNMVYSVYRLSEIIKIANVAL